MPTSDVAARLMAERGMDGQDRRLAERIAKRIVSTSETYGGVPPEMPLKFDDIKTLIDWLAIR